jgi:hypothetical protein
MLELFRARRRVARKALSLGLAIGAVAAGIGAAAAVASGGTTTGATTTGPTDTTTTTPPPNPVPPPAPSGFTESLSSLYSTIFQADQTLDSRTGQTASRQLSAPGDFSQQVGSLTPDQLGALYAATQQDPNWAQLGAQAQQVLNAAQSAPLAAPPTAAPAQAKTNAQAAPPSKAATAGPRAAAVAQPALTGAGAFPPGEPSGSFPAPPAPFAPDLPVTAAPQMSCFPGDPFAYYLSSDSAIFIAETINEIAYTVQSEQPDTQVTIAGVAALAVPNPIKLVLVALDLATEEASNSLEYAREVVNDCIGDNAYVRTANIDATTVNTFKLEQQNERTLASTEASVNTLHDQVHVAQQTVDAQLTIDIRRALSQPTTAPRNVVYELPTTVGGNLDSTPIGVKAIVTSAYNAAKQAGLAVNATATNNLTAANAALTAKSYRTAWQDFQVAFQALR